MGMKRVLTYECDSCGFTDTAQPGDGRNSFNKPKEPEKLAAWVEWQNWQHRHVSWHGEDGEARPYTLSTCPRCTWEDIKDWPTSEYLDPELEDMF